MQRRRENYRALETIHNAVKTIFDETFTKIDDQTVLILAFHC